MKLLTCHLYSLPRGMGRAGVPLTIDVATSEWTVEVEPDRVLVVSPPGWRLGERPEGTRRVAFEVPRADAGLVWERTPDPHEDITVLKAPYDAEPPPAEPPKKRRPK